MKLTNTENFHIRFSAVGKFDKYPILENCVDLKKKGGQVPF